jgi:predicted nucleotidyltransferase
MNPTIELSTSSKQPVHALIVAHKIELRAFGVKRLGMFGSFVRGEQRSDSDVATLVEFEQGRSLSTIAWHGVSSWKHCSTARWLC